MGVRSHLERGALTLLLRFVTFLPHRAALLFGACLGRLLWAFSWKKVDRAEARCVSSLGVGVTRARAVVRGFYGNLGRSAVEFARMEQLKPRLSDLVSLEGLEHLDRALARGRGVLILTGHFGNWELAGARLVEAGYAIMPIATKQKGWWGEFVQSQRRAVIGFETVSHSKGLGLREVFRTLEKGGVVAILQDLDARKDGVIVPFLGMPASTAVGIVKMHAKFGSPVVPVVALRRPDRVRHRLLIQEILSDRLDEDGNPFGTDMEKSLQMCNNTIEAWVRAYPDKWMWLQDRWKSTVPR